MLSGAPILRSQEQIFVDADEHCLQARLSMMAMHSGLGTAPQEQQVSHLNGLFVLQC